MYGGGGAGGRARPYIISPVSFTVVFASSNKATATGWRHSSARLAAQLTREESLGSSTSALKRVFQCSLGSCVNRLWLHNCDHHESSSIIQNIQIKYTEYTEYMKYKIKQIYKLFKINNKHKICKIYKIQNIQNIQHI